MASKPRDKHAPVLSRIQRLAFENAPGVELAEDAETFIDDEGNVWAEAWVRVRDLVFLHVDPDTIYEQTEDVLEKVEKK